jgi:F-type H+-transporting ATPase subunit c
MLPEQESLVRIAAVFSGGCAMGLGAVGAAIGEGYTAAQACLAVAREPARSGEVFKNMLVGQAVAESASIFALVIAILLLFTDVSGKSSIYAYAFLGAGLSMGFGALGSGIGSGLPAGQTCWGIVTQPSVSGRLTTNMLVGSAVCQTPAIFAMVVALLLMFMDFSAVNLQPGWAALLGAGLATGLSAIGSGIGGGVVAQSSSEGIARNPHAAGSVTNIMLLGQAISQTPAILGLLIGFILLFKGYAPTEAWAPAMALLSAGICSGIGGIGPGIGEGIVAASGVKWIARNESEMGTITRTMLVGMAVSESTAIYAMVVAMMLIFVL